MSAPVRRESRSLIPDLFELLEVPFSGLRPSAGQAIRVEDYVRENEYVIRAELPGIDPDKDLEISIARGMLTIRAERHEEHEGRHRSEFRYGAYERHMALPENIKDEEIKAAYDKGILTVTIPLHEAKEGARRIPVE